MADQEHGERDWIVGIRQGDERAFTLLFARYAQLLTGFADRYLHSVDRAMDVVQDVFIHLWECRDTLEIRDSVRSYLYTATRNRVIDLLRHDTMKQRVEAEFSDENIPLGMGTVPLAVDEAFDAAELHDIIDAAVETLPSRTRQAATLRWYDRLSRAEIAEIMGTSVRTVNNQLTAASQAVRTRLLRERN